MTTCSIKEISFNDIIPLWSELWMHCLDNVKPVNTCTFLLAEGYDAKIPYEPPIFLGAFDGGKLIGGNSVYRSAPSGFMRSRGLFVDSRYRGFGIGTSLIQESEKYARLAACSVLWGYPRFSGIHLWCRQGFRTVGEIFNTFSCGPHIWAYKPLLSTGYVQKS